MDKVDKISSSVGTWVPQVFFDIIARLMPGAVVVGSFALAGAGPERSWHVLKTWLADPPESYPTITVFIGVTVLSYTLAIVLRGLWDLLLLFAGKFWKGFNTELQQDSDFSKKYDFIKEMSPVTGNRITKLRAEQSMTRVLILGFGVSFGINLWKWLGPFDKSRMILGVILLAAIAGSVGAKRIFAHRVDTVVKNCAELLGYAKMGA